MSTFSTGPASVRVVTTVVAPAGDAWRLTSFSIYGAALILLCMSVNLLGDWLRDALNPKLR